jgi:hypothetical protein
VIEPSSGQVYVATVTGTMLLSGGKVDVVTKLVTDVGSATELLHQNLEFEYVAIRAGFFQGLMNWLIAIALQIFCESGKTGITKQAQRLCVGLGFSMVSMVVIMLSFYNLHLNYYANYAAMIGRLAQLFVQRYFLCWPPRVLPVVAAVPAILSTYYIATAFVKHHADEE